jgi:hypothetical protein
MIERFLIVPGWGGSESGHWQSIWERADARFERVEQADWDNPDVDDWIQQLDRHVRRSERPTVLVAHSLGGHAVAHWAERSDSTPIRAALVVAPPDIESSVARGADPIANFGPASSASLPFPAVLAASDTDPWADIKWSSALARTWGADFVNLGDCGHVNTGSGHGPWPVGLDLLSQIAAQY